MKRNVKMIFFVAILSSIFLTGCKQERPSVKSKKIRLELYNRKRETYQVLEQIIKKFNESQNEIEVFQNTNTYVDTALRISTVEGDFPDIVLLGGMQSVETSEYVMGGYLRPLDDMECVKRIHSSYFPYLTYENQIYQIPLAMSVEGIYVNKKLFSQENLEVPDTYEELCEVCEILMERGKVPFVFPDKESWTVHQNWECIEGAERGNFEEFWTSVALGESSFEEDSISFESLNKLIHLHQYTTKKYSELGYDEAMKAFANDEVFMFIQGSWAYRTIIKKNPDMDLEMIPFPVEQGKNQKTVLWVDSSVGISNDCKNPEAAKTFVEFLMRPEILQMYIDDECSFGSLKGTTDRAEYAPKILELMKQGKAELDASWLPTPTSVIRDKDVVELMPDATEEEIREYLKKYTKSLQKHKDLFMDAKEKKCHLERKSCTVSD